MEIQEILQELEHLDEGKFPRKALQEAIVQQEAITPALLDILQWSIGHLDEIYDDASYMEHMYAMYLLAQFREQRAYPLIVAFFSIPDERVMEVCGDLVTEDLNRILASVSDGEIAPICSLIENSELDGFIRGAGIRALVTLALCDEFSVSREDVMIYFQSLFRGKLERSFSQVWNSLVARCTDLYPEEVYDDIRQAYEDDLVEPFYIGFEEVEEAMAEGKEAALARVHDRRDSTLITDTIQEMEWWACFRTPEQPKKRNKSFNKQLKKAVKSASLPGATSSQPIRRTTPKVSRNAPCPCGSGKKYKKCCLNKK